MFSYPGIFFLYRKGPESNEECSRTLSFGMLKHFLTGKNLKSYQKSCLKNSVLLTGGRCKVQQIFEPRSLFQEIYRCPL